ncbi:ABC transporter permease subunit [Halomarina litorea]|uniref:ABC transporter permease subunit n=1 Tax=Halomarina litorea TaxID=2961595 RepID=UPI0020C487C3|nr:ABC transporter permease subunit [Halomarina sp. BCD28]
MSLTAVAKKDFQDAARSRRLLALIAVFVLFVGGLAYFFAEIAGSGGGSSEQGALALIGSLLVPTAILLPAIGVLTGYRAVSNERETGSLKILLSLPHSREDVVFGKFLGRSVVVTLAVVVGFAVGGIVLAVLASTFSVVDYVLFTLMTILLGTTFVSVGVGLSAGIKSENLVVTIGIALVVLFTLLWQVLLVALMAIMSNFELGSQAFRADLTTFLAVLSPRQAYLLAFSALTELNESVPMGANNEAFWLNDWFGFVVLAFWLVVPLTLGYLRFRKADL